jgi:hypothetical protein
MQALTKLSEALLETCQGNVDAAVTTADALLGRVSGPEFDLTGLIAAEASLVKRMPAQAWRTLQRYAQASNEVGITSVALSSRVDVGPTLVHGLAQLHLRHLALGRPVGGVQMARLQALPYLEHLSQRWAAKAPPEYAALLQQPTARAAEHSTRVANVPPRTARKMRDPREPSVAPRDRMLQARLNQAMEGGDACSTRAAVSAILGAGLGPRLTLQLLLSQVAGEPETVTNLRPVKMWEPEPSPQDARMPRPVAFPPTKIFVPELSAFVEDLDEEPQPPELTVTPVLGRLCGQLGPAERGTPNHPGYAAVSAYLQEILNSTLPAQDKRTICASATLTPQGPLTAAQLAMQEGHPLAVARMMLAVRECNVEPAEKLELLAMFRVSKEEVEAQLAKRTASRDTSSL